MNLKNGNIVINKIKKIPEEVKILFAGDLCPRGFLEKPVANGQSGEILKDILPALKDKDLSVVNFEAALTKKKYPILKHGAIIKLNPKCACILNECNFDVAALANNHVGDFGPEEAMKTKQIIENSGVKTVGMGKNFKDARKPLFISKKGIRIAILNFAENEFGQADDKTAGVAPMDPLADIKDIREASKKTDITIAFIHGGKEYDPFPTPYTVQRYRAYTDAGAAAVIATHTHCPQGMEIYNGKPIIYSMGNFLFPSRKEYDPAPLWWYGYMVKIAFNKHHAVSMEVIPHVLNPEQKKLKLLKDSTKIKFLKYIEQISAVIADDRKVKSRWDAWCTMKGPGSLGYINGAHWPVENKKALLKLMCARIVFTCEAHREVIDNFLRLVERNGLKPARRLIPDLIKTQNARF